MRKWLLALVLVVPATVPTVAVAEIGPSTFSVLKQLPDQPGLRTRIAKAFELLNKISPSELTREQAASFDDLAKLIITTSSVEKSPSGRYTVLYSTATDLYTILGPVSGDGVGQVFFVHGSAASYVIGKGRLPRETDLALRTFRQRPKLQRDIAALLDSDEAAMLQDLKALQQDKEAIKIAVTALLEFEASMKEYESSPCLSAIDAFRGSETFALRFQGGRTTAQHMIPVGMTKISNVDNVILQDDQLGRQFAFIETTQAPACQITKVRIFFSY